MSRAYHTWRRTELQAALDQIAAGDEPAAVAQRLGVSIDALKLAVRRVCPGPGPWKEALAAGRATRDERIIERWRAGEQAHALAETSGLTYSYVCQIIRRATGDRRSDRRRLGVAELRRLFGLRVDGLTYAQIAAQTGLPKVTVYYGIRRYALLVGVSPERRRA